MHWSGTQQTNPWFFPLKVSHESLVGQYRPDPYKCLIKYLLGVSPTHWSVHFYEGAPEKNLHELHCLLGMPPNNPLYNWVVFHPQYNPTHQGSFRGYLVAALSEVVFVLGRSLSLGTEGGTHILVRIFGWRYTKYTFGPPKSMKHQGFRL